MKMKNYNKLLTQMLRTQLNLSFSAKILAEKDIISKFELGSEYASIDKTKIIELSKVHIPFRLDAVTGDIVYTDNNDEVIFNLSVDYAHINKKNLALALPDVHFDVIQGGNKTRAK